MKEISIFEKHPNHQKTPTSIQIRPMNRFIYIIPLSFDLFIIRKSETERNQITEEKSCFSSVLTHSISLPAVSQAALIA